MKTKQTIRKSIRAQRRALSTKQRLDYARAAARRFCLSGVFLRSKRIAIYLANDGELNPLIIGQTIWRRKKKCFLPVVHGPAFNRMWFAPYYAHSKLKPNRYGIPEPPLPPKRMNRAQNLDLVLVPLVAFDKDGNRLGMGGGYYDRTFAYLRGRKVWKKPILVGLAYDFQQVDKLPADAWDIALDYIATESRLIRLN